MGKTKQKSASFLNAKLDATRLDIVHHHWPAFVGKMRSEKSPGKVTISVTLLRRFLKSLARNYTEFQTVDPKKVTTTPTGAR